MASELHSLIEAEIEAENVRLVANSEVTQIYFYVLDPDLEQSITIIYFRNYYVYYLCTVSTLKMAHPGENKIIPPTSIP